MGTRYLCLEQAAPTLTNSSSPKNMEEIREKFYAGNASATEAFEEMFARLAELEAERESAREMAKARVDALVARNATLRTKNQNLRAKYVALLDMYNGLAEEVKERSDSSSDSSDDESNDCTLM